MVDLNLAREPWANAAFFVTHDRSDAKEILNSRVKMREAFRPFAPAVLLEEADNWFEFDNTIPDSPFMLRVCKVKADRRNEVPAIVHVDGTADYKLLRARPTDDSTSY
jgi:carbamoyltransferase